MRAARRSIDCVKERWEKILKENGYPIEGDGKKFIPDMRPQPYYDPRFYESSSYDKDDGSEYAYKIPSLFIHGSCI